MDVRPLSVARPDGLNIKLLLALPRAASPKGVVVMPSPFGKKMASMSPLARALARCGWATLRFDLANHVGASDGLVRRFTLTSVLRDFEAVTASLPVLAPGLRPFAVATSLGARVAIRHAALQGVFGGLVLILPAVDALATIRNASNCDTVERWCRGEITDRAQLGSILGFTIELEALHDVFANGWNSVESTLADLARVRAPVTFISSMADPWVEFEQVRLVARQEHASKRALKIVQGTGHELSKNPDTMRTIVDFAVEALDDLAGVPRSKVPHLKFRELVETVTLEKQWARESFRLRPAGANP